MSFSGFLVVVFELHHFMFILAAALFALLFFGGFATAAGMVRLLTYLDIHQLSFTVMQVHGGACGTAEV